MILWIPTGLILLLLPFLFEAYLIKKTKEIFGLDNTIEWTIFLLPILIGIFTILHIMQVIKNEAKNK
jgi:uncharacterized membrane protein YhdT